MFAPSVVSRLIIALNSLIAFFIATTRSIVACNDFVLELVEQEIEAQRQLIYLLG